MYFAFLVILKQSTNIKVQYSKLLTAPFKKITKMTWDWILLELHVKTIPKIITVGSTNWMFYLFFFNWPFNHKKYNFVLVFCCLGIFSSQLIFNTLCNGCFIYVLFNLNKSTISNHQLSPASVSCRQNGVLKKMVPFK